MTLSDIAEVVIDVISGPWQPQEFPFYLANWFADERWHVASSSFAIGLGLTQACPAGLVCFLLDPSHHHMVYTVLQGGQTHFYEGQIGRKSYFVRLSHIFHNM